MAKAEKTNVMRILDQAGIPYRHYEYPHKPGEAVDGITVATLLGQEPSMIYKTLVTRGSGRDFFVFVLPVAAELNLKAAAAAVGEKSVEMIHVAELNKITGYLRGGCSPIGMKKQFRTVIDASAEALPSMIFSGGKIGSQVELAPQALADLIHAEFISICR